MIRCIGVAVALLLAGCVQAGTVAKPIEQNGRSSVVSRGEEGAIRDKVKQCWNIDPTMSRPVTLRIARIRPDGTVTPDAVSVIDDGGDPKWGNAARRAVLNPVCQPWPMPTGGWPDEAFILVFDARDLP
jgi:hypothetical protein